MGRRWTRIFQVAAALATCGLVVLAITVVPVGRSLARAAQDPLPRVAAPEAATKNAIRGTPSGTARPADGEDPGRAGRRTRSDGRVGSRSREGRRRLRREDAQGGRRPGRGPRQGSERASGSPGEGRGGLGQDQGGVRRNRKRRRPRRSFRTRLVVPFGLNRAIPRPAISARRRNTRGPARAARPVLARPRPGPKASEVSSSTSSASSSTGASLASLLRLGAFVQLQLLELLELRDDVRLAVGGSLVLLVVVLMVLVGREERLQGHQLGHDRAVERSVGRQLLVGLLGRFLLRRRCGRG